MIIIVKNNQSVKKNKNRDKKSLKNSVLFTKSFFKNLQCLAKHSKSENLTARKQISDEKNVKMTLMLPEGLGLFD